MVAPLEALRGQSVGKTLDPSRRVEFAKMAAVMMRNPLQVS